MKILSSEANHVGEIRRARARVDREAKPVSTVAELAAKYGIAMDEVRTAAERALMAEEDPRRERQVREIAQRVAAGTYQVEADSVVDMAYRRAIADSLTEL